MLVRHCNGGPRRGVAAEQRIEELALGLIDSGHGDPPAWEDVARRGSGGPAPAHPCVPMAVPRVHLIEGRLARLAEM